jgi:hypothetical protein
MVTVLPTKGITPDIKGTLDAVGCLNRNILGQIVVQSGDEAPGGEV